ncbi:MAG TPA: TIGR01777 family oxidoreductase [Ignavibacteriaceae bacterium]|nr:TIGR01777 family oxidoreductase [Ignavibacteriaceae bacterium]
MAKKIIITGATGLIGKRLCNALVKMEYEITVFTGHIVKAKNELPEVKRFVEWNYKKPEQWSSELKGKNAVIHLAGANLAGRRWNRKYKKNIAESRILSTKNIISAMKEIDEKPDSVICASAVGYYGDKHEELLTERSPASDDFLAELCSKWEFEASKAENLGLRWISLRQAPVLCQNEGMIREMMLPFKLFLGGPIGSGAQWLPWIHIDDLVNIYLFLLENQNIKGAVNASSPNPVRMNEFADDFGKIIKRPSYFKIPKLLIRIVKGELADSLTASQKVIPAKLLEAGFNFKFKAIEPALKDLLKKSGRV